MHGLIHSPFAQATAEARRPERVPRQTAAEPLAPRHRMRGGIARALAVTALRMHREATRRAVA